MSTHLSKCASGDGVDVPPSGGAAPVHLRHRDTAAVRVRVQVRVNRSPRGSY